MSEELTDAETKFIAEVATDAMALELTTVAGVIEGEDDDGNTVFVAVVVGVAVYDTLEEAIESVHLDDDEIIPSNVTIQ